MNCSVWSRACVSAAVALTVTLGAGTARAEEGDSLSLKIASALRSDRLFMRAGVILINIKTKSGETKDVSGPVITKAELYPGAIDATNAATLAATSHGVFYNKTEDNDQLQAIVDRYKSGGVSFASPGDSDYNILYTLFSRQDPTGNRQDNGEFGSGALLSNQSGLGTVYHYLDDNKLSGVGTPSGITGIAAPVAGTAGISVGYYLDDEYKWLVETYVLAAPVYSSVKAHGRASNYAVAGTHAIGIDGVKVITTKILPPTVLFGRYWGAKDAKFRPYTGVMAMYAIFADTKATDAFNTYAGGSNPGDTTVSIKNAFGLGPVVGMKYQFNDTWHASLNVGAVKLKTQATLTTRNTYIGSDSAILKDLGGVGNAIFAGENIYNDPSCTLIACGVVQTNGGLVSMITKGIIADRLAAGTGDGKSLGTYVRKTDTELNNTILFLSVGRTF